MSARQKRPTGKGPPPIPFEHQKTSVFDSGKNQVVAPATQQSSGSIKVVSMKTPAGSAPPAPVAKHESRPIPQVRLRAISEVSPLSQAQPQNLGNIAPPRNAAEVRKRRVQDYIIWGSVCVIVASVVALAIWFLAR
jgi:hypothetical protein